MSVSIYACVTRDNCFKKQHPISLKLDRYFRAGFGINFRSNSVDSFDKYETLSMPP